MNVADVRKLAADLAESTEQPHFHFASFRVNGKIFATAAPDGRTLSVFVGEEIREQTLVLEPESVEKLFWGGKAVGLQIKLDSVRPELVAALLRHAWASKAPRRLLST